MLLLPAISHTTILPAIDGSCYIAPAPKLTSLTITSIETLSIVGSNRNIRVHYTSDLTDPGMNLYCLANVLGPNFSFEFYGAPQNGYVDISVGNIGLGGVPAIWYIKLQALGITSNMLHHKIRNHGRQNKITRIRYRCWSYNC